MKILVLTCSALGFCASVTLLAACNSASTFVTKPPGLVPSVSVEGRLWSPGSNQPTDHLFVASFWSNYVSMYDLDSNKLLHRSDVHMQRGVRLADDSAGRLYAASYNGEQINVLGPEKKYISYAIKQGIFSPTMALDSNDNLYVGNENPTPGNIEVFAAGTNTLLRTITSSINGPFALAFDSSGNLYVANIGNNSVTVYAPGASVPVKTIADGIQKPFALALNSDGDLAVANSPSSGPATVTTYAAGSLSLDRTITDGVVEPRSLIFDSTGNLYVGDKTAVTVYAPGSTKVLRTMLTEPGGGGDSTERLAFDSAGILYVCFSGNDGGGVNLYAPGGETPIVKIRHRQGISSPTDLLIGP